MRVYYIKASGRSTVHSTGHINKGNFLRKGTFRSRKLQQFTDASGIHMVNPRDCVNDTRSEVNFTARWHENKKGSYRLCLEGLLMMMMTMMMKTMKTMNKNEHDEHDKKNDENDENNENDED